MVDKIALVFVPGNLHKLKLSYNEFNTYVYKEQNTILGPKQQLLNKFVQVQRIMFF